MNVESSKGYLPPTGKCGFRRIIKSGSAHNAKRRQKEEDIYKGNAVIIILRIR